MTDEPTAPMHGVSDLMPDEVTKDDVQRAVEFLTSKTEPQVIEFPEGHPQRETDARFWAHPQRARATIVDAKHGIVETYPKRKKVAIVGFADTSREAAPFDDPEWEIWSLNQLYRHIPRFDRWFEIHRRDIFVADTVRDTNYVAWLQTSPIPVYMMRVEEDMPQSVRFPVERVAELQGLTKDDLRSQDRRRWPYLQSTIAYMITLAIVEGFEEIGLWGIDLIVGDEYGYQKPNAEFWLGFAMARGIKITLPETGALLKQLYMYGPEIEPSFWPFSMSDFNSRCAEHERMKQEQLEAVFRYDGAISDAESLLEQLTEHPEQPVTADAVRNRIASLQEERMKYYDRFRLHEGAAAETKGWLEWMELVHRGGEITPLKKSWNRPQRKPAAT